MWAMIRIVSVSAVLFSAYCLTNMERAMATNHGQSGEIIIELKFPSSDSEWTGNSEPNSPVKKGENNTTSNASSQKENKIGNGVDSGFGGFKLEIIVPDSKGDDKSSGEASKESSTGAESSDKTEKDGNAANGNSSSPKESKSGKGGKASPTQKKTQKDKSKGTQGIDLGNPQGESEKKLDEIQKETDEELDRVNQMLDDSLKTVTDIIESLGKESQPSSSPPCTSTSGNVGVTHEFLDGIKECKCDGETCRWK